VHLSGPDADTDAYWKPDPDTDTKPFADTDTGQQSAYNRRKH
jgi:hypothetical protein